MVFRNWSAAAVVAVVGLSVAAAGCGKWSFGALRAQKAWKEANDRYRAQDWRAAAERYEAAIAADPAKTEVYFYLGNSYDNLYKPSRAGEPENDAQILKAIENYNKAVDLDPNPDMKKLALKFLVAVYGADKLDEPAKAEPVVQRMIQMDPSDPEFYAALSKIYEEAGRYEEAEAALLKGRDAKPNDPLVHQQIAGFYNRQGDFPKTMESMHKAAELEPSNPLGFYTLATYYEEKVRKDFRVTPAQKKDYIQKGIEATDRAIRLNENYAEALVYKNILLRHQMRIAGSRQTAGAREGSGPSSQPLDRIDQEKDGCRPVAAGSGAPREIAARNPRKHPNPRDPPPPREIDHPDDFAVAQRTVASQEQRLVPPLAEHVAQAPFEVLQLHRLLIQLQLTGRGVLQDDRRRGGRRRGRLRLLWNGEVEPLLRERQCGEEDDQEHEQDVDERRDVRFGLRSHAEPPSHGVEPSLD
jgi:tetratricopeptide (TPR) repeat protein